MMAAELGGGTEVVDIRVETAGKQSAVADYFEMKIVEIIRKCGCMR